MRSSLAPYWRATLIDVARVIFDSQVFVEQRHGGVSRYFLALAQHLTSTAWTPFIARGVSHGPSILPDGVLGFGPWLPIPRIRRTFRVRRVLSSILMRAYRPRSDGKSVYHPTWYHGSSLEAWQGVPIVITIHDLITEKWPEVTSPMQLHDRREAIRKARAIVCVSESTRAQLGVHYPWALEKAVVALLGLSELAGELEPIRFSRPYFVHVGKRGSYKDFATIVRALQSVSKELLVVTVGGGPPTVDETRMLDTTDLRSRVRFEPDITDRDLARIIDGSRGLISASREEGFGLPPLEALARGRPVILSDIAVYQELYSKWGCFFKPGDHEALAAAMLEVMDSPPPVPKRPELESTFSWAKTARITATAYEQAVA